MIVEFVGNGESIENIPLFQAQLDALGIRSGIAQNLNGPITTWEKFIAAGNQTLLVYKLDGNYVGYVKFGRKDLYFYDKAGKVHPKSTYCVLDFYVNEEIQRNGIGRNLFERMLQMVELPPCAMAYDRPSPLLIAFMRKHYQLTRPDLQPNRFAIFEGFSIQ